MDKLLTLSQTGSWVKEVINEELMVGYKKFKNLYHEEKEHQKKL
jgi:hypothetical protein